MTSSATLEPTADRVDDSGSGLGSHVREMFSEATLDDTVERVLSLALELFRCDEVGLLLAADGAPAAPVAASHDDVARADALQLESKQGPGLQAIAGQQPVIASELRFDSRWRFWAPLAADLGFRSALSLGLADGDTTGAITLYSRRASRFSSADLPLALDFAQHASIAIAVATERQQLLRAIESRGMVGQAQGILMQRYGISDDQSSEILRRYAQHLDEKLRHVAGRVVRDRKLPELDDVTLPTLAQLSSGARV
jgi:GAF domain-containing protein